MNQDSVFFIKPRWAVAMTGLVALATAVVHGPIATAALLYSSESAGTISSYPRSGVRSIFASNLKGPQQIAFDKSGNIYIVETGAGVVLKITPTGSQSIFAQIQAPEGVAIDAAGNVYISSFTSTVFKFTPGGTRSTFATGAGGVLAFDQTGNLYASEFTLSYITRITPAGAESQIVTGLIEGPNAMAFDVNGNVFISQFNSGDILEITPAGARSIFASELHSPSGLAFDASGNLFAAASNGNAIFEFTPSGVRSTFFLGTPGFYAPGDLAFNPVPEPSSLILIGIGVFGFAVVTRRTRTLLRRHVQNCPRFVVKTHERPHLL